MLQMKIRTDSPVLLSNIAWCTPPHLPSVTITIIFLKTFPYLLCVLCISSGKNPTKSVILINKKYSYSKVCLTMVQNIPEVAECEIAHCGCDHTRALGWSGDDLGPPAM